MKPLSEILTKERDLLLKEYKYLEQIQEILKDRKQKVDNGGDGRLQEQIDKSIKRKIKTILNGTLFRRGVGRTERKAFKYEQKIESAMQQLAVDVKLLQELRMYTTFILKKTDLRKGTIISILTKKQYFGLGTKERELDWNRLLAEVTECIDNGIKPLLALLDRCAGSVLSENIQKLKKYGFPVERYPEFALFLAERWRDVEEIHRLGGTSSDKFFRENLPQLYQVMTPSLWNDLVIIIRKKGLWDLKDLENILDLVKEQWFWKEARRMLLADNDTSHILFDIGNNRNVKKLITKDNWAKIVDAMIIAVHGRMLLLYAFPSVPPAHWLELAELSHKNSDVHQRVLELSHDYGQEVFSEKSWPIIKKIIAKKRNLYWFSTMLNFLINKNISFTRAVAMFYRLEEDEIFENLLVYEFRSEPVEFLQFATRILPVLKETDILYAIDRGGRILGFFLKRLATEFNLPIKCYFIHVQREVGVTFYSEGQKAEIAGKKILVVDEYLDLGQTRRLIITELSKYSPEKVFFAAFHVAGHNWERGTDFSVGTGEPSWYRYPQTSGVEEIKSGGVTAIRLPPAPKKWQSSKKKEYTILLNNNRVKRSMRKSLSELAKVAAEVIRI